MARSEKEWIALAEEKGMLDHLEVVDLKDGAHKKKLYEKFGVQDNVEQQWELLSFVGSYKAKQKQQQHQGMFPANINFDGAAVAVAAPPPIWKSLVPVLASKTPPRTSTTDVTILMDDDNEEESRRTKRKQDDDENYNPRDSKRKRLKYWEATRTPITVSPTDSEWYLGEEGDELFVRQATEEFFDLMWKEVEELNCVWADKNRKTPVAFIVTGAPGVGKSWCSNAMVWYLVEKRQSMWFHSASQKTLTMIEFKEGIADPVVTPRNETDVHHHHPAQGTWFLYVSVGNARSGQTLIPFTSQPSGVPCIIFSSPKDSNYRNGLADMETQPRGSTIWYLWYPTWGWIEIEAVMPSLYKAFRGEQKTSTRDYEEFQKFIKAMYDIWGGIPRRFVQGFSTFEKKGKDAAIAEAETKFKIEMGRLAPKIIQSGPMIEASTLDTVHQTGERDNASRNVSPPSWLLHPVPIDSADDDPFRTASYRFCSNKAEVMFLEHLAKSQLDVIRTFCRQVFQIPAGAGLAFERFAHFVLTRTEVGDYRWRKYDESETHKLTLPKCTALPKCDMKTSLSEFKKQIAMSKGTMDVVIDPLSDQQDAIDMFLVLKNGRVLAMQDTISKTHSFHPLKILEYRKAAREALESVGITVSDDFFLHVVVVPTEEESKEFQLQLPTMSGLKSLDAVKAKFEELGLVMPSTLDGWNVTSARKACSKAGVKNYTTMSNEVQLIKGAEVLLLEEANKEVKHSTWVLDGFFEG